tara:strand:+ start:373 stop:1347 length:975 start_codon:yes stop_codon:yes gene_type:complete
MINKVKLSLIVVTYNSQETIKECLNALIDQIGPEDKILVYDNGSSDNTPIILKEYQSKVSLYLSPNNFGFSYACNWCAKKSDNTNYLAFINPDAVLNLGLIDRARETFADSSVSLVGFSCKDKNGLHDKNFRRFPSILSGILTLIDRIVLRLNFTAKENFNLNKHYLDGSCMFVDRDIFIDVGLFEDLFLYGEDVILCSSLRHKKIKAIYHPDISYLHLRGSSSSLIPGERSWSMLPNMIYSELFYLRSLGLLSKMFYLILKVMELIALIFFSTIFFYKNAEKKTFFRKRLILLLKYSPAFLWQGRSFIKPEFHLAPIEYKSHI